MTILEKLAEVIPPTVEFNGTHWRAISAETIQANILARVNGNEMGKLSALLELLELQAVLADPAAAIPSPEQVASGAMDLLAHKDTLEQAIAEYDHRIDALLRALDSLQA